MDIKKLLQFIVEETNKATKKQKRIAPSARADLGKISSKGKRKNEKI